MATDRSTRAVAEGDRERPAADRLHIGAGEEDPDGAVTLDAVDYGHIDYVHDLREPWPFVDATFNTIVANHVVEHIAKPLPVFREAARCLRNNGHFIVRVPAGVDALADPTHADVWTWRTPEAFSTRAEPWQPGAAADLPLELMHRNLELWSHWGGARLSSLAQWLADRNPLAAQTLPACSGELTATFRRVER